MMKNLVVVDKFPVILRSFEQLIGNDSVCEILGCFTNTTLLINTPLCAIPDIIILGIDQNCTAQDLNNFYQLKDYFPTASLIVNDYCISYQTFDIFINLGASGYFVKNRMAEEEVIHGISEVLKGRIYICKDVSITLRINLEKFDSYFKSLLDRS